MATEDVVYLLNGLGFKSGIDLEALARTGDWISKILGHKNMSMAGSAISGRLGLS